MHFSYILCYSGSSWTQCKFRVIYTLVLELLRKYMSDGKKILPPSGVQEMNNTNTVNNNKKIDFGWIQNEAFFDEYIVVF